MKPHDRAMFAQARLEANVPFADGMRAQDHWRVNVGEPWEVRFWSREFACSEDELRKAVREAGDGARRVRAWLAQRAPRSGYREP
jgi:hypothetical protein